MAATRGTNPLQRHGDLRVSAAAATSCTRRHAFLWTAIRPGKTRDSHAAGVGAIISTHARPGFSVLQVVIAGTERRKARRIRRRDIAVPDDGR